MLWYGLDSCGSGLGPVGDSREHGNEPSGSMKCREFLGWLSDWWLLRMKSAPWSQFQHGADRPASPGNVSWLSLWCYRRLPYGPTSPPRLLAIHGYGFSILFWNVFHKKSHFRTLASEKASFVYVLISQCTRISTLILSSYVAYVWVLLPYTVFPHFSSKMVQNTKLHALCKISHASNRRECSCTESDFSWREKQRQINSTVCNDCTKREMLDWEKWYFFTLSSVFKL
jgi:hypothetical protein